MKRPWLVVVLLAIVTTPPAVLAQRLAERQLTVESVVADEVRQAEERFRRAKLSNDVAVLQRIVDEAYVGTNQNGNSRDKRQMIDLFRTFPVVAVWRRWKLDGLCGKSERYAPDQADE